MRCREYRPTEKVSALGSSDLYDGRVIGQVHGQHTGSKFVSLSDENDPRYLAIRIILDSHPAHMPKETTAYLTTKSN